MRNYKPSHRELDDFDAYRETQESEHLRPLYDKPIKSSLVDRIDVSLGNFFAKAFPFLD